MTDSIPRQRVMSTVNSSDYVSSWWETLVDKEVASLSAAHFEEVEECSINDPLALITEIAETVTGEVVATESDAFDEVVSGMSAVLRFPQQKAVAIIKLTPTAANVRVYAETAECAIGVVNSISSIFPRKKAPADESTTPFAFWRFSASVGGARFTMKDLECPSWEDVRHNYTTQTQESFDKLISLERPDEHGKIILWHGPAGTGKTHLVRALAREWSERLDATVEFVLDHQSMFSSADYMYTVLLDQVQGARMAKRTKRRRHNFDDFLTRRRAGSYHEPIEDTEEQPLRLVVIEDGADLFSVDCRHREGFSRFLNVSDGIVGQGLRIIFLLTANEKIDHIDPAVKRAGRCLQTMYFPSFDPASAAKWLADKNFDGEAPTQDVVLADLYAIAQGREPVGSDSFSFGFSS